MSATSSYVHSRMNHFQAFQVQYLFPNAIKSQWKLPNMSLVFLRFQFPLVQENDTDI